VCSSTGAGQGSKHAARYQISRLVYFEHFQDVREAIAREKRLKRWHRQWKIELIESVNRNWDDLYDTLSV
jgi:putative endonuclease